MEIMEYSTKLGKTLPAVLNLAMEGGVHRSDFEDFLKLKFHMI